MMRAFVLLLSFAVACGGSTLSPRFPVADAAQIDAVVDRIDSASTPRDAVAAGVLASGELYLVDLESGQVRWRTMVDSPAAAPIIAGEVVVLHSARGVVGYELTTGAERFSLPDGAMTLVGAAGEENRVAIALSTGGGVGARSRYLVMRGSSIAVDGTLDHALGVPALRGGVLFLPWASQNLSCIDASSGEELARVQTTDSRLGWVGQNGGDVFYGQDALFVFGQNATPLSPAVDLPGDATFVRDPYGAGVSASSAEHKIRMDWRPTLVNAAAGSGVALADDLIFATFYRAIFGLDVRGQVRFAAEHPSDIVGGAVTASGTYVVGDEEGALTAYDASGARVWSVGTDMNPVSLAIQTGNFEPPSNGASASSSLDGLLQVASSSNTRILPARLYAVSQLATVDGSVPHLVELCQSGSPRSVQGAACDALSEVSAGAGALVSVLERGADVPLVSLAPSVGRLLDGDELGPFVQYLNRPNTTEDELDAIFSALLEEPPSSLASGATVEPVMRFLQFNHADGETSEQASRLGQAARVLLLAERAEIVAAAETEGEESLALSPHIVALRVFADNSLAAAAGRRAIQLEIQNELATREAALAAQTSSEETASGEGGE